MYKIKFRLDSADIADQKLYALAPENMVEAAKTANKIKTALDNFVQFNFNSPDLITFISHKIKAKKLKTNNKTCLFHAKGKTVTGRKKTGKRKIVA